MQYWGRDSLRSCSTIKFSRPLRGSALTACSLCLSFTPSHIGYTHASARHVADTHIHRMRKHNGLLILSYTFTHVSLYSYTKLTCTLYKLQYCKQMYLQIRKSSNLIYHTFMTTLTYYTTQTDSYSGTQKPPLENMHVFSVLTCRHGIHSPECMTVWYRRSHIT